MKWTKLVVQTTNEAIDAVTNILMENGAEGVQIDDSNGLMNIAVITYFSVDINSDEFTYELQARINNLTKYGLNPGKAKVELTTVDDESWDKVWEKYYHPTRVTRYLTVVPSWKKYQTQKPEQEIIRLNPGKAFGTGTHPTTRLILQALEMEIRGEESVYDVGTGSGVLSIAALLLGAKRVQAFDVDSDALASAKLNFDLNPIAKEIKLVENDLLKGIDAKVDLIVANILPEFLIPLTPQAFNCLSAGGKYIVSGIISDQKNTMIACLHKNGFEIDEILNIKDWYAISAHVPTA